MRQRGGCVEGGYLTQSHFRWIMQKLDYLTLDHGLKNCNQLSIRYEKKQNPKSTPLQKQTKQKCGLRKFHALQKMDM